MWQSDQAPLLCLVTAGSPRAAVLFCDCRLRARTIAELIAIGDGVPATIELGYHLRYGSEG
jgi:hypothetical protein